MNNINVAVFAYNFEHKKTQDILLKLFFLGFKPACVFAANPLKLNIAPSGVKTKVSCASLVAPESLCRALDIPYYVVPHDDEGSIAHYLKQYHVTLGIVAGARIIKESIIHLFELGIVNFHPGLIPEVRGLDALLWSIKKNIALGVSAHLIDRRVDFGQLLIKEQIVVRSTDTIFDLSQKLYDKQLELLESAIKLAVMKQYLPMAQDLEASVYNRKMSLEMEQEVLQQVAHYVAAWAVKG